MGNKSSSKLKLFFLLSAAFWLEARIISRTLYYTNNKMNWTQARLYCQEKYVDLYITNYISSSSTLSLGEKLVLGGHSKAWIGLHRDPAQDSVWKGVDTKTGEGLAGNDRSGNANWAADEQSGFCAAVKEDLMWYSVPCSTILPYYCTVNDEITNSVLVSYNWIVSSEDCVLNAGYLTTVTQQNAYQMTSVGWIGLYREGGDTWNWTGQETSNYMNWAPGEPQTEDCGSFDPLTLLWYSESCSKQYAPICFKDNLVIVNEEKTWEDALSHCRSLKKYCGINCSYPFDIVSLSDTSDLTYVRNRIYLAAPDEFWIGLRFLAGEWFWLDGADVSDNGMLPNCPSDWKHCGMLSKHDTNNWITRDCTEKRSFICYRGEAVTSE